MKKPITFVALAGVIVGFATTASLQSFAQSSTMRRMPSMGATKSHSPSMQMHSAMMAPMQKMGPMSGNTDRDFASMMLEHHRSAVAMAKLELKYGKNAELKALSRNIIRTQTAEISILLRHTRMMHPMK